MPYRDWCNLPEPEQFDVVRVTCDELTAEGHLVRFDGGVYQCASGFAAQMLNGYHVRWRRARCSAARAFGPEPMSRDQVADLVGRVQSSQLRRRPVVAAAVARVPASERARVNRERRNGSSALHALVRAAVRAANEMESDAASDHDLRLREALDEAALSFARSLSKADRERLGR
jgi:hypothetical protein